jgi:hypothetical protein
VATTALNCYFPFFYNKLFLDTLLTFFLLAAGIIAERYQFLNRPGPAILPLCWYSSLLQKGELRLIIQIDLAYHANTQI